MDTNSSARQTATASPSSAAPRHDARHRPRGGPRRDGPLRAVLHRWPLALGVGLGVLQVMTDDPHAVEGVLLVLLLATVGYVVIAALVRPAWSWPVIGVLTLLVVGSRLAGVPAAVELAGLLVIAAGAIVVGVARGTWGREDLYRWQPWAAVLFLGVACGALAFDPDVARVVVAVGLIGHTAWDVVHWRRHAVVSRSLAEWCAGLDLTLGVGVLLVPLWM